MDITDCEDDVTATMTPPASLAPDPSDIGQSGDPVRPLPDSRPLPAGQSADQADRSEGGGEPKKRRRGPRRRRKSAAKAPGATQLPQIRADSPARGNHVSSPVYGAIDLGTNNCRLLVARPTGNGFKVVDAFSRIVRLGEGVASSGRLSDAAIARTIDALKICARKMRDRGVTHMRNVATQACRQAENCDDFVSLVKRQTGLELDIIRPAEEARLAVMGCQALLDKNCRRAIVFDIGGGSTELIWTAIQPRGKPKILGWISMPLGVVTVSEQYNCGNQITAEQYDRMVSDIRAQLVPFDKRYNMSVAIRKGGVQMLGTSGTVTTLTSLHLGLPRYDRAQVDGAWVNMQEMLALCKHLSTTSFEDRIASNCIGTDRAELIIAGCAILDAILQLWPVDRLRVADRGIREGMLIELMQAEYDRRKSATPSSVSRQAPSHV